MQKAIKYAIFQTKWGYFGLAAGDKGLFRTCLPLAGPEKVESQLLQNLENSRYDRSLFKTVQDQITAYFEGACIDFRNIPITLDEFSPFQMSVLTACRNVGFGRTISYSGLAKKIGRPAAARAVGGALAKNPLPLIIPCHRIVRSDGKIGGFSALGGPTLKRKMLLHEKHHC
ncbi:MAG: methylated-DNA--[protein]-cysteine S-methyltransferase [Phycisphaerae bacterium]|nr:methylated-DNA--[protein]-cysteine S-methyltransferase [Phycisphaerae bacterium]